MTNIPRTHIIYISGLGDGYDGLRRFCLRFWHIYGVTVEFIPTKWSNGESLATKMERIQAAVKQQADQTNVVLVGESAGGSLALNVYASMPDSIYRVVTICGKNTQPNKVSPHLYRRNPSFRESMHQVEDEVYGLTREQRQRVTSLYPIIDHTVPPSETFIADCRRVRLWSVGHITSIFFTLTLASFVVIREARRS